MSARIPREKVHSFLRPFLPALKKMEQSKRRSGLKLHGVCNSKVEWSRGEERGQSWPLLANRLVACLPVSSPLLENNLALLQLPTSSDGTVVRLTGRQRRS